MKIQTLFAVGFLTFSGWHSAYAEIPLQNISLPETVDITLSQNAELLAKSYRLEADSQQINQAEAKNRPNIRLNGNYGRGDFDINGVSGVMDTYNRATVSLVQSLYSKRNDLGVERAYLGVDAAGTQFELDKDGKILELVEVYLDYLKYLKLFSISQLELEDHVIKVERLQALLNRGLATKMDMLEAESSYDILQSKAAQIENDMRIRKVRLHRLLGAPVESVQAIDENLWQRSKEILGHRYWLETSFNNHPSLLLVQQQARLAKMDVDVAKSGYYPEVALRAEVTKSDSLETSIEGSKRLQIELSVPLYDGGDTDSRVTQSRALLESSRYQLQDRKQFLQVKLEETIARMDGNLKRINALNETIDSSRAYLDAAQKGLSYGLRGVFDVLEAKSRVYDSRRQLTNEIYDNLLAQFEFLYLIGRLDSATIAAYLEKDFSVVSLR
ncbi:peptidase [Thiosulfatimonas sediminis]|uniref:Peptidase n=1 Tax=Thiosulfatimonas sediminis TaxID=2675054 RepID=A0A6F8PSP1_9GAMM|nr:TolC family protein [Thiosulfatimonas sediminis]BBP45135.1 peptidase [Thiosulfatimonas sediminis]